jgi:hypothetical protein
MVSICEQQAPALTAEKLWIVPLLHRIEQLPA